MRLWHGEGWKNPGSHIILGSMWRQRSDSFSWKRGKESIYIYIYKSLYLTWNLFWLISHPLYMSSQPQCRRYNTNSVGHHRWHRYAIICTIHDIISTLYENSPQYSWYHMHYIWHVIYCVWYHIHYMCDITQCLYLWHHALYVYNISTLYSITYNVMKTQLLCNFTATMSDIIPTVSVPTQPVDHFYQT